MAKTDKEIKDEKKAKLLVEKDKIVKALQENLNNPKNATPAVEMNNHAILMGQLRANKKELEKLDYVETPDPFKIATPTV